jgi:hypothetical protein
VGGKDGHHLEGNIRRGMRRRNTGVSTPPPSLFFVPNKEKENEKLGLSVVFYQRWHWH